MLLENNDFFALPPNEIIQTTHREVSVMRQTNQETLRRNLDDNFPPQHPLAPEY